jgi:hypothetical protein
MDIIEALTVADKADVVHWNEDPDSDWPMRDQLFWRQTFDIEKPKAKQLSVCLADQLILPAQWLIVDRSSESFASTKRRVTLTNFSSNAKPAQVGYTHTALKTKQFRMLSMSICQRPREKRLAAANPRPESRSVQP